MTDMTELYMNDHYKVLLIMQKNQTAALGKRFVPLMQSDLSENTGFGRSKIIKIMQDLTENGYITKESRGRYSITDKGEEFVSGIEKLQRRIDSI